MPENVLVVDNALLRPFIPGPEPQLITNNTSELYRISLEKHFFIPRPEAEEDYTKKQVIPYVVATHNDRFLMLRRTARQTEARLHNRLSLGIGGHINPTPQDTDDIIIKGLFRELDEEVSIPNRSEPEFQGVINDETNNVSKVHLGMLFTIRCDDGVFEVLEKDLMTAQWAGVEEIDSNYDDFETWSQIVIDRFIFKREPQAAAIR